MRKERATDGDLFCCVRGLSGAAQQFPCVEQQGLYIDTGMSILHSLTWILLVMDIEGAELDLVKDAE